MRSYPALALLGHPSRRDGLNGRIARDGRQRKRDVGAVNTAAEGFRPNFPATRDEYKRLRWQSSTLPFGRGKRGTSRGRTAFAFFARLVENRVRRIVVSMGRRCILPVCAPCPECRYKRRLTQEFCRHCGSPFPAPRPDGTEIVSDLAGERFLFWAPGLGTGCEVLEVAA